MLRGLILSGPFADDGLYQLSHVLTPVLRCRAAQRATINPSLPFPENREMAFSFPENASYHTSHFPGEGHPRDILSSCTSSVNPGSRSARGDREGEFRDADVSELMEMLGRVPEFRGEKGRQYALTLILAVCVVATLAGAETTGKSPPWRKGSASASSVYWEQNGTTSENATVPAPDHDLERADEY